MKKIFATIGLKFDSNKNINELTFKLPEGAEILSATNTNNEPSVVINFMAKKEIFASDLWREYEFVICKCYYTEIDFDGHEKYIGTIKIENDSFAIFYRAGIIA